MFVSKPAPEATDKEFEVPSDHLRSRVVPSQPHVKIIENSKVVSVFTLRGTSARLAA